MDPRHAGGDLREQPIRARLRTPRAAAAAGIVFSLLLTSALTLIRLSAPSDAESAPWLTDPGRRTAVAVALNLVPFAGIAFLWFIGVVRDRIGELEDRFFASVFLGSGLLFVAMLFVASALAGGLLVEAGNSSGVDEESIRLSRRVTALLVNVYAMRMAAVFTIVTSTIGLRTRFLPRWMAVFGYGSALVLLVSVGITPWVSMLFPLWVLVLSLNILVSSLRERPSAGAPPTPER